MCALLAAVCIAITMNILRHIGQRIHFTVATGYNGLVTVSLTGAFMAFFGYNFPCQVRSLLPYKSHSLTIKDQIIYIIYCGLSAVLAQTFLILALQLEKAARVAIIHQSQVLFGFLIQVFYLGEKAETLSLVGAMLILLSSTVVGLRKLLHKN